MGLKGKLIAEVELKSSGDLFHEMFSSKPHHIANVAPKHVQGCEVHQGEFGKVGSIIIWKYAIDGKSCVAKEIVEAIDKQNKLITFKVIEGDLMKDYKDFKVTIDIKPVGHINLVKWTVEYQKLHEDIDEPLKILELTMNLTKNIEAHHLIA